MKIGIKLSSVRKLLSLLLIILVFIFAANPYSAWVDSGFRLEKRLTFSPYASIGSVSVSHFNEAFWQWNSKSSVYNLQRSLTTHNFTDYYTVTGLRNNRIYRVANSNEKAPASARTVYLDGKVLSADINLNTYYPMANDGYASTYDVWTIFIHEAGHILGFDHSSLDSVMNVYPVGTVKRYLTTNDIAGINSKYNRP